MVKTTPAASMIALAACAFFALAFASVARADVSPELLHAFKRMDTVRSFHLTQEGKHMNASSTDVIVGKGMHQTMADGSETIVLGAMMYNKFHGTWTSHPFSGLADAKSSEADFLDRTHDWVTTDLGPRTVDGLSLHEYELDDPGNNVKSLYYIDEGSGLIVRYDTSGVISRRSNFNVPVTIAPPI